MIQAWLTPLCGFLVCTISKKFPRETRGRPVSSLNRRVDGMRSQKGRNIRVDWSVALGSGNVPANMFPAKYQFNVNGTPSCTTDYVVYGLNVAGVSNGQPNLVGINNLYSGTGGFCGANPAVYWAYNGSTASGSVLTSPTISMDGTKIAYVESGATSAVFHVLTWKSGDGTIAKAKAPDRSPVMHGLNKLFNLSDPLDNRDYYVFIGVG